MFEKFYRHNGSGSGDADARPSRFGHRHDQAHPLFVRASKTPWQTVFNELKQRKINTKNVSLNSLEQNERNLSKIFAVLGKSSIESLTYKDCHLISDLIYNLPKFCTLSSLDAKRLLTTRQDDRISPASARKYLNQFKELLLFAKKRRFITESFAEDLEILPCVNGVRVEGFSKTELKKIFNPETYPKKDDPRFFPRFWIPLIALFSGMRLNEICQLYTDDIRCENGVYYFCVTDKRADQHLKNSPSRRQVPVHPMLIDMGFLEFVKEVRRLRYERLFYVLNYHPQKYYRSAVGAWFNRYLAKLGMTGRQKVFHSLRHTVKPYLRDAGVSQEYQNALCGWSARDTGEKVYGGAVPMKRLQSEMSKLKYGFLEKTLQRLKQRR
jgi:integrase